MAVAQDLAEWDWSGVEVRFDSEGKATGFPDWSDAELKAFTKRFYTQFAKRYDADQRSALNVPNGPHGILFEDLADYQVSYMIGNDQQRYQNWDRIRRARLALGYRFVVTSFETSGSRSRIWWKNEGLPRIITTHILR